MLKPKGIAAALVAGALSLGLVAAQTAPATSAGTAETALSAVELTITGLGDVPALQIIDAGTFASTDTDKTRNARGAGLPFAAADIVPLKLGSDAIGAASARSDGSQSVDVGGHEAGDALGVLGAVVNPLKLNASATAAEALATVSAATAQLDALTGALGISVDTNGVVSQVTADGSSATQGLKVAGIDLDLGDLLPADVLANLPIDVLIDLLEQLPVGAPDIQALVDAVTTTVATLEKGVQDVVANGDEVASTIASLEAALAELTDAEALVASLEADLADAEAEQAAAQTAVNEAQALITELQSVNPLNLAGTAAASCIGSLNVQGCIDGLIASAQTTLTTAQATLASATAAVDNITAALADAVSALQAVQATVDQLTDLVDSLVATLVSLVNDLLAQLGDVLAALTNLSNSLSDVVEALASGEIATIGALDIGVNAVAGATEADSSATVLCAPVNVSVAGQAVGTADCSSPLTSVNSVLSGALATVNGVLEALPITQVEVPDVSLSLFGDVSRSVTTNGDYVESVAHVTALDLQIPSVTIDPAALVDGVLAGLSLDLVDQLLASLPGTDTLADLGLGDAAVAVQGALDQLPTVADLQSQLNDVLALLPDGSGLTTVSTPGLGLVVDPTSTASFRSGTAPAPTPDDTTPLPATGGGLALLGMLTMAGAAALRRRN